MQDISMDNIVETGAVKEDMERDAYTVKWECVLHTKMSQYAH